jgi:Putative DNA-binding domain
MSWPSSPAWLLELQASFGEMLRSPLDRSTGSLRANNAAYPASLVRAARPAGGQSGGERLAVYNRQYWFRLFTVLQRAFPLTSRLIGFWHFNEHAADFLLAHPPRGWDLDRVGAGFADFLSQALSKPVVGSEASSRHSIAPEALLEAARLDDAYHAVFRAPDVELYAPSSDDAGRLLHARLRFSPAAALLTEHWPLADMRRTALAAPEERTIKLEPRLSTARHWLLRRDGLKLQLAPLEPRELQLLTLLSQSTVGTALAQLEHACETSGSAQELLKLPANAQKWLARSVQLGVWVGADFAQ